MGNICDILKREIKGEPPTPIVTIATPSYIETDLSNNIPIGKPVNSNLYPQSDPIPIVNNNVNNLQPPINIPQTTQPIIIYSNHPYPYYPADNFASGLVGGLLIGEMLDNDCY